MRNQCGPAIPSRFSNSLRAFYLPFCSVSRTIWEISLKSSFRFRGVGRTTTSAQRYSVPGCLVAWMGEREAAPSRWTTSTPPTCTTRSVDVQGKVAVVGRTYNLGDRQTRKLYDWKSMRNGPRVHLRPVFHSTVVADPNENKPIEIAHCNSRSTLYSVCHKAWPGENGSVAGRVTADLCVASLVRRGTRDARMEAATDGPLRS